MRLAYLAGPYTADSPELVEANVNAAIDVQVALMESGFAVFCPHTNYGHDRADIDYVRLMHLCFKHLENCDLIVLLPGWEKSRGACMELGYAIAHGLEFYFWPQDMARLGVEPKDETNAA